MVITKGLDQPHGVNRSGWTVFFARKRFAPDKPVTFRELPVAKGSDDVETLQLSTSPKETL